MKNVAASQTDSSNDTATGETRSEEQEQQIPASQSVSEINNAQGATRGHER